MHEYPYVPKLVSIRVAMAVLPFLAGLGFLVGVVLLEYSSGWSSALFYASAISWNLMVAEVVRGIGAGSVSSHTPAMIGRAAWIPDPAGGHAIRYWDGHRFTEFVADPEAGRDGSPESMVTTTDVHTGPQWEPPAPAWERLGRLSAWSGVLAIGNLPNLVGFAFVPIPCAVFALRWGIICARDARCLGRAVPGSAIAGVLLGTLALLLFIPFLALWNAVGNGM